jgi:hypothetical protein
MPVDKQAGAGNPGKGRRRASRGGRNIEGLLKAVFLG